MKVLDFGVAKLLAAESLEGIRTRNGTLLGTPAYMSPEQCAGGGEIDHRVDVYALGCLLFEMLTGRPPFCPRGAEPKAFHELALAHIHTPPPSPRAEAPDVPRWLDSLVQHLMAKRPDNRPRSMRAAAEALARQEDVPPPPPSRSHQRGMGVPQLAMAATGLLLFPLMIVFVTHLWSARHRDREIPLVESTASPLPPAAALTAAPAPVPRLELTATAAPSAGGAPAADAQSRDAAPPPSQRRGATPARRRAAQAAVAPAPAATVMPPPSPNSPAIGDSDGIVNL